MMTIDFARNVLGLERANSTEMDPQTPHPVIDLMEAQRDVHNMGGTQRLGAYIAELAEGSQVAQAYGTTVVSERHRHRYEFNSRYRRKFEDAGFRCIGSGVQEPAQQAGAAVPGVRGGRPGSGRGPQPPPARRHRHGAPADLAVRLSGRR
jgi:CTP synthase (UTP-ammonia lyase)